MKKHHFTVTRKMMILHTMWKEKGKLKKKNALKRNNMASNQMGVVN